MQSRLIIIFSGLAVCAPSQPLPREDGYRGIWYANEPSKDEYRYKYSGGLGTYPQQQGPIAHYSRKANKSFFVYGGTVKGQGELLHMVSYYDHQTGRVPRPVILLNKRTDDAHDNPVLTLDAQGHLWVFSNSHGTARPSFIHRSRKPYSIEEFDLVLTTNFSYGHAWFLPGAGFFFPHTLYVDNGRSLFWMSSPDGRQWSEPRLLARMALGHYQITWQRGRRVAAAFNDHPPGKGLNGRTNLYYLETSDRGETWTTVRGRVVQTPLTEVRSPAMVHDYEAEGLLVYLKSVDFDTRGQPVILYLTSRGHASGPANDPRLWRTARWTGTHWEIREAFRSDHNYDFGSLYIEPDRTWRVIAPTAPGPQQYCTGGEMVLWVSRDQGRSWRLVKQLTRNSPRKHTYARKPVDAHPDFYALWADGDAKEPSESHLYFTDKEGTHVWRLPATMTEDYMRPEIVG